MWVNVFLGLGSNVDNPVQQINSALSKLANLAQISLLKCSSFYLSTPVDKSNQNDFINMAVKAQTCYPPLVLLEQCKAIEQLHDRQYLYHWGPRSLDIDILSYGKQSLNTPKLTIPHKEIANRDFVIQPLLEIEPELSLPSLGYLKRLPPPPRNIIKLLQ